MAKKGVNLRPDRKANKETQTKARLHWPKIPQIRAEISS